MRIDGFISADVLEARRRGINKCPCGAEFSLKIKVCPECGRLNPYHIKK